MFELQDEWSLKTPENEQSLLLFESNLVIYSARMDYSYNWPLERVLLSSQGRFDISIVVTAFTVLSWEGKL